MKETNMYDFKVIDKKRFTLQIKVLLLLKLNLILFNNLFDSFPLK